MRAALGWSNDLLSGPERVLFRRLSVLSVFVGAIPLEAAEAVGDTQGGAVWPLDLLSALVEQSLATVYPNAGGEARYGLLEPVRQYGLEKLEHSGEFGEIQRRHAEYFLGLSEGAAPELWGAG